MFPRFGPIGGLAMLQNVGRSGDGLAARLLSPPLAARHENDAAALTRPLGQRVAVELVAFLAGERLAPAGKFLAGAFVQAPL
jgi:hypothetical protein